MSYEKKLAKLLVEYSLNVQPNKIVSIHGDSIAEPLIKELYKAIVLRGAYPMVNMSFDGQAYDFYKNASFTQLDFVNPIKKFIAETEHYSIHIDCDSNTKELSRINPSIIARWKAAQKVIREIYDERETAKEFKWVYCPYPSNASAQDAEMSLEEYREFVWEACKLNGITISPTSHWLQVSEKQESYLNLLKGTKLLYIVGENVNITANVEGRTWVNCDGKCNMPDGEIYTSPVENGVNGHIKFDYPACYNGYEVEGVSLVIENGIITEASATKNEEFLKKMIAMDEGSNKIGEIAFGVNESIKTFSKNILFDEKIGGTMHMAIGAGYPDAGGLNKSGLHWDIVKSMKDVEVFADGKLIYSNQKFIDMIYSNQKFLV